MSRHDELNRTCDLLAAYEMGLLEEDERARFEEHLDECPQCLDDLYAMAPLTEALRREPGRFAGAMKPAREPGLLRRWFDRLLTPAGLGVAAPVAVAAVLALVFLMPDGSRGPAWQDLAVLEPAAFTRLDLRGGALDEAARLFEDGMAAYNSGDFATAAATLDRTIEALNELPGTARPAGHKLDQVHLYQGVSHLLAGHDPEAVAALTAAAGSSLPPVSQRARWHLAQAHLAAGRPVEAVQQLEMLAESPVYQDQVRTLLAKIEALNSH